MTKLTINQLAAEIRAAAVTTTVEHVGHDQEDDAINYCIGRTIRTASGIEIVESIPASHADDVEPTVDTLELHRDNAFDTQYEESDAKIVDEDSDAITLAEAARESVVMDAIDDVMDWRHLDCSVEVCVALDAYRESVAAA